MSPLGSVLLLFGKHGDYRIPRKRQTARLDILRLPAFVPGDDIGVYFRLARALGGKIRVVCPGVGKFYAVALVNGYLAVIGHISRVAVLLEGNALPSIKNARSRRLGYPHKRVAAAYDLITRKIGNYIRVRELVKLALGHRPEISANTLRTGCRYE